MRHSYADARPSGTPGVDESVVLNDGRRLQVAIWGAPEGIPVVFLHGRPGSRLFCPDLAVTEALGVRLISFDRAGYGRSDPGPWACPSYRSSVGDVLGVLDHLGIDRTAVIGFSGGGPHALAFGAWAADRVTTVTTVCSMSWLQTIDDLDPDPDPEVQRVERAVLADPVAARTLVRERAGVVLADTTWVTRMTERYDPHVYEAPKMRELYQANWEEATAVSVEGYVDDWILETLPWDFDPAAIEAPVFVWYGEGDVLVPSSHAATIANGVARSTTFACPDCRHYVPVAHWPEILERAVHA